jgi:intracellular multiplication protein IcmP
MADGKPDGGTEQFMGWMMILIVFLAVMWVMYTMVFTDQINNAVRWWRYAQMWIVSLFVSSDYMVTLPSGIEVNLEQWMKRARNIDVKELDVAILSAMSSIALMPLKWFFAGTIGIIGLWTYTKGPGTQYVEVFNLDRFIKFQSKSFPIISPFVEFNPSNQPPRAPGTPVPAELPLFAEALGPEEWLAYHQIPIPDGVIDQKAAFNAFAKQLGPRWKGPKGLKPYEQILLAACCYKAARKRDKSDEMMGRLAQCWSHDKGLQLSKSPNLIKEARRVLKNKDLSYNVLKKCNQHAWVTTALLRALLTARDEGGVMAPAQFVWLRGHNRTQWYPLNNLGRQSHHMEAIGAMAHFKAEKRAERPIPRAKVQDAVDAIVEYMADSNARPIPALDYSTSKKRGIKKLKSS